MSSLHLAAQDHPAHAVHRLHPNLIDCQDPKLRQVSAPVDFDNGFQARRAWASMEDTLQQIQQGGSFRSCIGISAIQLGIPLRQCIIWTPHHEYVHIANPQILEYSAQMNQEYEGCLSFFESRGLVRRPYGITLRYLQKDLSIAEKSFTSWAARVIQHEIDHMNGILYTDRMAPSDPVISYEDYLILKAAS